MKALESKSRLMHVVSKLLAKNGEFVAYYVRTPDIMSMITSEQITQYNIKLETKSEEKQLDEMRQACSDNGMQITKLNVDVYANYLHKYNMNPDLNGPSNFGPAFQVEDKTSPAFAFMKNIMFDIALRPDATALNPHAYDQMTDKWDPNGPIVPIYVHGIHLMSYKL
ncbi:unnamed protein product [Medioppia subpectinata]|uniref:Uncharacterized protein n=1 Tax=Medioppia subpectinata TaxID=1979941 RepID=A0A7R9Q2R3_9ACAR|nr:unnamed protein product [Medioppia subpectinata]CAG2110550.1 unnamed protein product [Medioppia subpectinata]